MDVRPPRSLGLLIGSALVLAGVAAFLLGVLNLGEISGALLLWGTLPVVGAATAGVAGYHLYGLLTARYVLNREGIGVRWGFAEEEIPLSQVRLERPPGELRARLRPGSSLRWPGCLVGRGQVESIGQVEFFATRGAEALVLVRTAERALAISPPDPEAFEQAFAEAARLGPLDPIQPRSVRPDLLASRLWGDPTARWLILAGLVLPLSTLGYLGLRSANLPDQIPFGFDALGTPGLLVAPSRLLLLPLMAVLSWLADLILGAVFYQRTRDRWMAYALWATAVAVGGLLGGAVISLAQSA